MDNDQMFLEILGDILRQEGFSVKTARDGKEGLAEIRREPPDILFTDLIMPKISGEQLIRHIRSHPDLSEIVVAVVSGAIREYGSPERLGADYCLEKKDLLTLGRQVRQVCQAIRAHGKKKAVCLSGEPLAGNRKIVEELMADQRQVRKIFDSLQAGLIVYDFDGKILEANPVAERMLQTTMGKLLGTSVEAHFPPESRGRISGFRKESAEVKNGFILSCADRILDLHFSGFREDGDSTPQGGVVLIYDLTDQKGIEHKLEKKIRELDLLNQIARLLTSSLSDELTFNLLLEKAVELLDAEAGTIALLEKENDGSSRLVFRYTCGLVADRLKGLRLREDHGLIGWVVGNDHPVIVSDVEQDDRFFNGIDRYSGFTTRSVLCVPIKSNAEVIGAIELVNKRQGKFDDGDLGFLRTLVELSALSIKNTLLHRNILRQRNYFSGIMENINEGLLVLDRNLMILDANPYFTGFLNRKREEILGRKCHEILAGSISVCSDCFLPETGIFSRGAKFRINRSYPNHENVRHHFMVSGTPLDREAGVTSSVLITFSDITRIERVHGYLQASASVASLLLKRENVRQCVDEVLEIMGRAAGASRAYWYEWEKYPSGASLMVLRQEWCGDGVAPRKGSALEHMPFDTDLKRWEGLLSSGKTIQGPAREFPDPERSFLEHGGIGFLLLIPLIIREELRGLIGFDHGKGRGDWQEAESNLLRAAADSLAKAMENEEAREERINLLNQLHHSQRMEFMGKITSGISHNFRNILTGIMGLSQLIPLKYPQLPEIEKYAGRITKLSKDGSDLIGNLLKFSRKEIRPKKPFNLSDTLRENSQIVATSFDKKIAICQSWPESLPVLGDASEISQVIMNLCTNARDAMPEGGTLKIEAGRQDDRIFLSVTDTGCGMDEETTKRIFDPFFTTKVPGEGTGLGLYTAHGIVQSHGGTIDVRTGPGQGSTITIFLPVPKSRPPEPAKPCLSIVRGNGEKILLVDDDPSMHLALGELLSCSGFRVRLAENGNSALELYRTWKPDLVLMDRNMPGMDGLKTTEKILCLDSEASIVIVSGYDETGPEPIPPEMGRRIKGYITKPFEIENLTHILSEVFKK